jgi:putative membrane protein
MLSAKQLAFMENSMNRPVAISAMITDWIRRYCTHVEIRVIEVYLGNIIDAQGALERIMLCPIPFSYVAHVHHILLLYLLTLPFCLLVDFGWYTSIAVSMISISLLGIDQAATHIEDPFGTDPSGTFLFIFSNK